MTVNKARILVIDDEKAIRKFLIAALGQGYHVFEASTGSEGISAAATHHPDLILLDLGLPDMDGIVVTQRLREWTKTPILILSVREDESGKIAALDAGADDYVTKPFGTGELLARIRVALRRAEQAGVSDALFDDGWLKVDLAARIVSINGVATQLTPNEYDLLRLFIAHRGKVLTHKFILQQVWGDNYSDGHHLLQVNVSNLRKKIEQDPAQPQRIRTEPGVGYRFTAEPASGN